MNAALILAGGKGERISGYDTPKPFIEIGGKTVISYSLDTFERCPDIDRICVVADEKWRRAVGGCIFAPPGVSRQHSIYNGLLALRPYRPDYVVVHDAARPLVTLSDICGCIKASAGYDGATPVLPVNEAVYISADGKTISSALNRDEMVTGQTPECYDFELYLTAHEKFADILGEFRGSSETAVKAGMKIACAKGNYDNFKITLNADLERFKLIAGNGGAE